jgi:hypothetical protein
MPTRWSSASPFVESVTPPGFQFARSTAENPLSFTARRPFMGLQVQRVQCAGAIGAMSFLVMLLAGCGDGGGAAAAASSSSVTGGSSETSVVTQSDIVLPSSVQVVTAK